MVSDGFVEEESLASGRTGVPFPRKSEGSVVESHTEADDRCSAYRIVLVSENLVLLEILLKPCECLRFSQIPDHHALVLSVTDGENFIHLNHLSVVEAPDGAERTRLLG